jgi:hypothetical protein
MLNGGFACGSVGGGMAARSRAESTRLTVVWLGSRGVAFGVPALVTGADPDEEGVVL